jgi:hypothetical protein
LSRDDETLLKPFVLADTPAGNLDQVVTVVKKRLLANGFEVAGSYSPYDGARVVAVTSDDLRRVAGRTKHGGFGAAQRVAVTEVNGKIQVSYTNPVYLSHAYRMHEDLGGVAARLEAALGKQREFGSVGLAAAKLRKYHYALGMEYFINPSLLAEHASHDAAIKAVEQNLAAGVAGVTRVYRVDIPGRQETVFGVGMKAANADFMYMDDRFIMSKIDTAPVRSTAHLPYEMLVSGNRVYALYARFRIAISFPDLPIAGTDGFMNIMSTPEDIREALTRAAGGIPD